MDITIAGITFILLSSVLVLSLMKGWRIILMGVLLTFFGRGAMFSVSIYESFSTFQENYFYFFEQVQKLFIGLVLCVTLFFTPWRIIKKLKYVLFFASLVLVLLLFTPLAYDANKNINLRLQIAGNTIQPGEFFKIGYTLFITSWLVRKRRVMNEYQYYLGFLVMMGIACIMFFLLPDIGTIFVLAPVSLLLFRYVGGKPYYIVVTGILGFFAVLFASSQYTYVQERIEYFLNPSADSERGIGWQTNQALIAVGGGGLIGKGYGKGLQKFGYIPEAQSDFIFAAFSEEVGFLGNSLLLLLYFLLAKFTIDSLGRVKDEYDRSLVVGLLSLILFQACVNIGVNIKLLPITGVTLPFISHGGSALIANMLEIVLMHKIVNQK